MPKKIIIPDNLIWPEVKEITQRDNLIDDLFEVALNMQSMGFDFERETVCKAIKMISGKKAP